MSVALIQQVKNLSLFVQSHNVLLMKPLGSYLVFTNYTAMQLRVCVNTPKFDWVLQRAVMMAVVLLHQAIWGLSITLYTNIPTTQLITISITSSEGAQFPNSVSGLVSQPLLVACCIQLVFPTVLLCQPSDAAIISYTLNECAKIAVHTSEELLHSTSCCHKISIKIFTLIVMGENSSSGSNSLGNFLHFGGGRNR